jgi:hypothetical protein
MDLIDTSRRGKHQGGDGRAEAHLCMLIDVLELFCQVEIEGSTAVMALDRAST